MSRFNQWDYGRYLNLKMTKELETVMPQNVKTMLVTNMTTTLKEKISVNNRVTLREEVCKNTQTNDLFKAGKKIMLDVD